MHQRWSDTIASLLPVALIVVALGAGFAVASLVASSSVVSPLSIRTTSEAIALRYSSLWLISYVVFIVLLAWNSVVTSAIVMLHIGTLGRCITGILVAVAIFVGRSMSVASAARSGSVISIVDRATRAPISRTAFVSSALAAGLVVLVVAAVVALGRRSAVVHSEDELRRRLGETKLFLFSAAALLASALASIYFTIIWPVYLPAVPGAVIPQGVLRQLAVTVALTSGIFYTFALIVLFAPIAVIHHRWVEETWSVVRTEKGEQSRAEWSSKSGLDRSIFQTGAQIAAVVAPWIAALGLPHL
jgi:hypothetical protein